MMKSLYAVVLLLAVAGCDNAAVSPVPAEKVWQTVSLEVPAIHCEVCVGGVSNCLKEQPGVMEVSVDVDTKVATIKVDEAIFDADKAIASLTDAQFAGSSVRIAGDDTPEAE